MIFGLGGHDLITYGFSPTGEIVGPVSWVMTGATGSYHETGLSSTLFHEVQGPAPTAPTGADPGVESGINIEGVDSMTVHVVIGMEVI